MEEKNIINKIENKETIKDESIDKKTKTSMIIIIISMVISVIVIIASVYFIVTMLIGATIYNTATNIIEETTNKVSEQEKIIFNQRFQKYEGEDKSGIDINLLVNELMQNHLTQVMNDDINRLPEIIFIGSTENDKIIIPFGQEVDTELFNQITSKIKVSNKYKVIINIDNNSGIVSKVEIIENALVPQY